MFIVMNIDLEKILQPIADEKPIDQCSAYIRLKTLRNELRRQERKAIEEDNLELLNFTSWQEIINQSIEILIDFHKNLEVVSWVLEGEIRVYGLNGLEQGLNILVEFVKSYKEKLTITYDAEDPSLLAIQGLFGTSKPGTLINIIYLQPLLSTLDDKEISFFEYQQNKETIVIGDMDLSYLEANQQLINSCINLIKDLNLLLDATCVGKHINTSFLLNALNECSNLIKTIISKRIPKEQAVVSNENIITNNQYDFSTLTRQQAFVILEQLVDFFKKHEPLSPTSYALERIANWNNISLPQILNSLPIDQQTQNLLALSLGINSIDQ